MNFQPNPSSVESEVENILKDFLGTLEREKNEYFRYFIDRGWSCEKWLHAELAVFLVKAQKKVRLEESYRHEKSTPLCDVVFNHNGTAIWMEMKAVPTSYYGGDKSWHSKSSKATDATRRIAEDWNKLKDAPLKAKKCVFFVAYPFPKNRKHRAARWEKLLATTQIPEGRRDPIYRFDVGEFEVRAYLAWRSQ